MEFRKALRLLHPLMIEGIRSVRNRSHHRVVDMLHHLEFVTQEIRKNDDSVVIELKILDSDLLYLLLAGESNNFFLAARISHERSIQTQPNNASWQAIENYYAAYYSIHYLMRLTGLSITNLDSNGASAIVRSFYAKNLKDSVPTGVYYFSFDDITKILTLTKKIKKVGGSHQDAWAEWVKLIDVLRVRTNTDPVEYAELSVDLAEHRQFLSSAAKRYNPPEIRGLINYQFKGGPWVFEKEAGRSIGVLQRAVAADQGISRSNDLTAEGLVHNNKIIIGLAKAAFLDASEKYPKGICRSIKNRYSSYLK